MILSKNILILEDNLTALSKILEKFALLEQNQQYELCTIQLSCAWHVEDYINNNPKAIFDIILLDGDAKLNDSFHVLDIERFGPEKVIAISSIPKWNEEARKRGVKMIIEKNFLDIDEFAQKVTDEVGKMIENP